MVVEPDLEIFSEEGSRVGLEMPPGHAGIGRDDGVGQAGEGHIADGALGELYIESHIVYIPNIAHALSVSYVDKAELEESMLKDGGERDGDKLEAVDHSHRRTARQTCKASDGHPLTVGQYALYQQRVTDFGAVAEATALHPEGEHRSTEQALQIQIGGSEAVGLPGVAAPGSAAVIDAIECGYPYRWRLYAKGSVDISLPVKPQVGIRHRGSPRKVIHEGYSPA